jgi:large subunit ribosomal protein L39e
MAQCLIGAAQWLVGPLRSRFFAASPARAPARSHAAPSPPCARGWEAQLPRCVARLVKRALPSGDAECASAERCEAAAARPSRAAVLTGSDRAQPSNKSFKIKKVLAKKQRQNRPIPQWIRMRTGNTIR